MTFKVATKVFEVEGASAQSLVPAKKYTKTAIAVAVIGVAILAVGVLALTPVIIAIPAAAAIAMVAAGGAMMLGGGIWAIMQGLSKEKAINPTSSITPRTGLVSSEGSGLLGDNKELLNKNTLTPDDTEGELIVVEEVDLAALSQKDGAGEKTDNETALPERAVLSESLRRASLDSSSAHRDVLLTLPLGQDPVPCTGTIPLVTPSSSQDVDKWVLLLDEVFNEADAKTAASVANPEISDQVLTPNKPVEGVLTKLRRLWGYK